MACLSGMSSTSYGVAPALGDLDIWGPGDEVHGDIKENPNARSVRGKNVVSLSVGCPLQLESDPGRL